MHRLVGAGVAVRATATIATSAAEHSPPQRIHLFDIVGAPLPIGSRV